DPYACYAGTSAKVPIIVVVRFSVAELHRAAVASSAHSSHVPRGQGGRLPRCCRPTQRVYEGTGRRLGGARPIMGPVWAFGCEPTRDAAGEGSPGRLLCSGTNRRNSRQWTRPPLSREQPTMEGPCGRRAGQSKMTLAV